MRPQWVVYLAFILLMGNFLSLLLQGTYFQAEDLTVMNFLTGYSSVQAAGSFGVVKMAIGFFTTGIPRLIMWDFVFLQGQAEIIKWFFMVLTIGTIFGMGLIFIETIRGLFARR